MLVETAHTTQISYEFIKLLSKANCHVMDHCVGPVTSHDHSDDWWQNLIHTDNWPRILYMTVWNIQNPSPDHQDNTCFIPPHHKLTTTVRVLH